MSEDYPKVLLTTPTLGFLEEVLAGRYETVPLWEASDGPLSGIRALSCLGHESLAPILERLPDLALVACFTTGYDGIDVSACRARGIEVTHAPGATAYAVAEYAIALTLALSRNVVAGAQIVLRDEWRPGNALIGSSLRGARMGIIGLGDIGRTLAELAGALGMEVSWWGPREKPDSRWHRAASLANLVAESDVVAVCARADASNKHLLSREILSAMQPHAVLVNVARGQLVDEDALLDLLRSRKIGGAGLDVFELEPTPASRWINVPNVVVTPHIGGATRQSVSGMNAMLVENLDRFFRGEPVATPVPE